MSTGLVQPGRARIWAAPLHLLVLALALILSEGAHARGGSDFRDRSVIGKWKLVSVLDIAAIASLDEAEAKTLLGKYVTISTSDVKVDEEVCPAPEFWAERIAPEPHIQEKLHSSSERLRLPNPAVMVELGCTDAYIRNPRELVLLWGGAMFEAVRIIPKSNTKPKSPAKAKRGLGKLEASKAPTLGKSGPTKPAVTGRATVDKPQTGKPGKPATKANAAPRKSPKNRLGT